MLGVEPPARQTPSRDRAGRTWAEQGGALNGAWHVEPRALATWLVATATVVYLGLRGGGYSTTIWGSVGMIVDWAVLVGALLGFGGGRRPTPAGWVVLAALCLLTVWSAAGMAWSESTERTLAAVGRDATYLGILAVAIAAPRGRHTRHLIAGVATGIVVIAAVALLSRLHPAWFPRSATASPLPGNQNRLSYPLNYWNALAELMAIGLPLVWSYASRSRHALQEALATAALPILVLTVALTLSRGGFVALALAVLTCLALAPGRGAQLLTALVGGAGGAVLTVIAFHDHALRQGLRTASAHHQGNVLLAITVIVCVVAGLVQLGLSVARRRGAGERLAGTIALPAQLRARAPVAVTALALVAITVFLAAGGARRLSHAWTTFKHPAIAHNLSPSRLESLSGHGRYQFWQTSLSAMEQQPLHGIGAGTWELWWTSHGELAAGYAQNAHSLLFEALAETGVPGGVLIVLFLGALLVGTVVRALAARSEPAQRAAFAAIAASCVAFIVAALIDWVWQVPVVPVCLLLLAAPALAFDRSAVAGELPLRRRLAASFAIRAAVAVGAAASLVAIAIPLETAIAIQQSQQAAAGGALAQGLRYARTATRIEPYGASPWMQEAAVLERGGDLKDALGAALRAQSNEPDNWRAPLIVARIEAERGDTRAALAAARRALRLNRSLATLLG